jgi:L-asparaginase II
MFHSMDPISVTVRRGPLVEAVHRVHAVAVENGRITDSAGDPALVTFFRSSSKPIQALPLARERDDVTEEELAIASASHRAEPAQLAAVESLLAKVPATEDDLECGTQEGRGPSRLAHNCSGKHAGFLAVCRARNWGTEGYRLESHPLQQLLLDEVAAATEAPRDSIVTAVDGCGVLTFGVSLERMAHSFARLEHLPGGGRIVAAMRAHPELIGYERGALDTELMRAHPGWIAKGGAEGLICAASPDGTGVALKVEDGNMRALRPALAKFVGLPDGWANLPVTNSRGETVGEIAVE